MPATSFVPIASLGSITAAVPIGLLPIHHPPEVWTLGCIIAGIVVSKHRANIRRLLHGEEYKL